MTASVAATELAKLSKCEAMIKKSASHPRPAPAKRPQSPQGTDNTLRGFGVSSPISGMKRQPCAS